MEEQVIAYADKALSRLQGKFAHLLYKGKSSKTVVTATARELAGFVWGTISDLARRPGEGVLSCEICPTGATGSGWRDFTRLS
jgi:hypothetical protein